VQFATEPTCFVASQVRAEPQQSLQHKHGKTSQPLLTLDGVLTLLQIHDQHGLPEQHAKEWAAEEEIAPPTTIEVDIETISHDKGLSSQGLELACGILNGCRDEASSKSATEARASASAASDDAPVPQYRQVDVIDRHSSTYKADILAEITSASSGETPEGLTVPACTQHGDTGNGATTHFAQSIPSHRLRIIGNYRRTWAAFTSVVFNRTHFCQQNFQYLSCIEAGREFRQAIGSQQPATSVNIGPAKIRNLCYAPDNGAQNRYRQTYEL
jgi:hypothetical protein